MTKYTAIDDPQLQADARESLRRRFPALNEADIENLASLEEGRLYTADLNAPAPLGGE